ncbi:MAG: septum formation initiator family protein [Streptosporangiaceae bacterium]|jgi:cell division protein FtsB
MTAPADRSAGQPDSPRFTGRAALLAVVLCAIALSLAYPVREYIAQSRRIGQLEAQRQEITAQVNALAAEQRRLSSPAYVEQQARDNLHMCLPSRTCYVIVNGSQRAGSQPQPHVAAPAWYERLWNSVQRADKAGSR